MAGHYAQLCSTDDIGKVTRAFEQAITLSFVTNPMPSKSIPQAEIKRRFTMCDDLFGMLRGDLHWSIPKIADVLPTYLKCRLDGVPFDPARIGSSWSPSAVDKIHDVPRAPVVMETPIAEADSGVWDGFDQTQCGDDGCAV